MTTEVRTTLIAWGIATAIGLVRLRTPEQWANLIANNPRLAGLVKIARGAGFDFHAVVEGLALLVLGQGTATKPALALPSPAMVFQWVAERRITPEQGSTWLLTGVAPLTANAPTQPANVTIVRGSDDTLIRVLGMTGGATSTGTRADKTPAESEANAAPLASTPYPGHEVPPLPSVPELVPSDPPAVILAPVQAAPVVAPLAVPVVELVSSLPRDPAPYDHRVQGLIKLMAAGKYAGKTTDEDLATLWGIEPAEVTRIVQKAAASLTAALPPPPAAPVVVGPLAVPADVAPVALTVISTP